jgi:hypothetical protein
MIYEHRLYKAAPGKLPQLIARFENHVLDVWKRLGIEPVAFWTVMIGESNQVLIYILRWKSLAEREEKFAAFLSDPEWLRVYAESERDGALSLGVTNTIMKPTSFSAII